MNMNNLKCILMWTLCFMTSVCIAADGNWCIRENTFNTIVTKAQTKIMTFKLWYGVISTKIVSYTVTDLVPRSRQERVCCEGYTLDRVHKICEPNCPHGCPEFSNCARPNACECQSGYLMRGNRCEPICASNCYFCLMPYTCSNDDSTTTEVWSTVQPTTRYTNTPEKPHTSSTKTELPSTEMSLRDSTIGETVSTSTTFTESTTEVEQTTLHYLERNAVCGYEIKCFYGVCRWIIRDCQCNEGFIHAWSGCHRDSGFQAGECVPESLCTTTPTSREEDYPQTTSDSTSPDDSSDNCEDECHNGLCVNGLCQCPKGSVFSPKSSGCVVKSSCDEICHNGICQEDGVCKCHKGFVYQYAKGCVRDDCEKKCINGVCESTGKCRCLDGFRHNPKDLYECVRDGKLSGKHERQNQFEGFPWIWILVTLLIISIVGLVVLKRVRKFHYDVYKVEKNHHIVQFDCRDV